MSLLSPYYIVGLLALLIPLLIHLWNRPKPILVDFGSVQLLKSTEAKRRKRIFLWNWPLLLLRCLLLALACIFLAKPFWKEQLEMEAEDRLYYVARDLLEGLRSPTVMAFMDSIDTTKLRPFRMPGVDPGDQSPPEASHWEVLKALEGGEKQSDLIVLLDRQASNYRGTKPCLEERIEVHFADTESQTSSKGMEEATLQTELSIYFDQRRKADVRYVKAAAEAVLKTQKKSGNIKQVEINQRKDYEYSPLCFYLSEAKRPELLRKHCGTIVEDAAGPLQDCQDFASATTLGQFQNFDLYQISRLDCKGEALMQSAEHGPLLCRESKGESCTFSFASRFSPEANEWVELSSFPDFVQDLMYGQLCASAPEFNLLLSEEQARPCAKANLVYAAASRTENRDLKWYLWFALCFLFASERLLANSKSKKSK